MKGNVCFMHMQCLAPLWLPLVLILVILLALHHPVAHRSCLAEACDGFLLHGGLTISGISLIRLEATLA